MDRRYNVSLSAKYVVVVSPIIIFLLQTISLILPKTRYWSLWMLKENHPIELLTFTMFFLGGILGLFLAQREKRGGGKTTTCIFYVVFSACLLFIAMEEIAWGQWFLGFETPDAWAAINEQGETTIHNLVGLQGRSEIFRLASGIAGLAGMWLSRYPAFRKIAVPKLLFSWFIVITAHAAVDVFNDFIPIQEGFDEYITTTQELIEMYISFAAFLYVWFKLFMVGKYKIQA